MHYVIAADDCGNEKMRRFFSFEPGASNFAFMFFLSIIPGNLS
jgi:hypothetical protein